MSVELEAEDDTPCSASLMDPSLLFADIMKRREVGGNTNARFTGDGHCTVCVK
jgi:hypothetical protein